jgi:dTDP-4-dehydrorhamnose reductase
MRILIPGHTGFIGKSLVERFNTKEIMTIGREWSYDITISEKIKTFNPDYIIHCAAEIKNSSDTFS